MASCLSTFNAVLLTSVVLTLSCHSCYAQDSESSESQHEQEHEQEPGEFVVLFVFFSLLVGAIVRHLLIFYHSNVPYTVLLLLLGMLWGGLSNSFGFLGQAIRNATDTSPQMILFIFLPALIFESSFSTDFHIIKCEFGQALLLAGPGIIIATALTGVFVQFLFGWGWHLSFMYGAMISATDPVAVVALLRDVGASKRLATLIEAESLLNDGTAFVFYVILKTAVITESLSYSTSISTFFQLSFGGVAVGLVAGLVSVFWLDHVFQDTRVEAAITIFSAYLTFWFAELPQIKVSGVLAVVFLGLFISKNKAAISPNVEESVHHVWEMIAFAANTIIFLLSGAIVAQNIVSKSFNSTDVGSLLLLFVMLIVIRGFTVLILFPLMSIQGYALSWKDGVVLAYGGLRGAIALSLALITRLELKIDGTISEMIMFFTSGIVLLTLLVNASTLRYLLILLDLTGSNPESAHVYNQALNHLKNQETILLRTLKHDRHYAGADWGQLRKRLPDFNLLKRELPNDFPLKNQNSRSGNQKMRADVKHRLLINEVRLRLLGATKAAYWQQFEEGLTSKKSVTALVESAERAMDCGSLAEQWHVIETEFEVPLWQSKLYSLGILPSFSRYLLFHRLAFAVEIATAFVEASRRIDQLLVSFPEFGDVKACDAVKKEMKVYHHLAEEASVNVMRSYPEVYRIIRTRHVAELILHHHAILVNRLFTRGIIFAKERDTLREYIDHHTCMLQTSSLTSGMSSGESILSELSFIVHLTHQEKRQLLHDAEKRLLSRGDYLYRHGERSQGIYVLARGLVHVCVENSVVETIGIGSVIGAWSFLSDEMFFADAQAHSLVEAFFLGRDVVNNLIRNPRVESTLWKMAGATVLKAFFSNAFPRMSMVGLTKLCSEAELVNPIPLEDYKIENMSLLVNGRVSFGKIDTNPSNPDTNFVRRSEPAPLLLSPCTMPFRFTQSALLLVFSSCTSKHSMETPRVFRRNMIDNYLSHYTAPKLNQLRMDSDSINSIDLFSPNAKSESEMRTQRSRHHLAVQSIVLPDQRLDRMRKAADLASERRTGSDVGENLLTMEPLLRANSADTWHRSSRSVPIELEISSFRGQESEIRCQRSNSVTDVLTTDKLQSSLNSRLGAERELFLLSLPSLESNDNEERRNAIDAVRRQSLSGDCNSKQRFSQSLHTSPTSVGPSSLRRAANNDDQEKDSQWTQNE